MSRFDETIVTVEPGIPAVIGAIDSVDGPQVSWSPSPYPMVSEAPPTWNCTRFPKSRMLEFGAVARSKYYGAAVAQIMLWSHGVAITPSTK